MTDRQVLQSLDPIKQYRSPERQKIAQMLGVGGLSKEMYIRVH